MDEDDREELEQAAASVLAELEGSIKTNGFQSVREEIGDELFFVLLEMKRLRDERDAMDEAATNFADSMGRELAFWAGKARTLRGIVDALEQSIKELVKYVHANSELDVDVICRHGESLSNDYCTECENDRVEEAVGTPTIQDA